MKLYDFGPAANAQRVRVFLAEKGLRIPTVEVNVREGKLYEEPYASMNPFHCVPFLELDDGRVIAESVSICRYLEEMHPEPPLFGGDPAERATVDMWNRRIELDGFLPGLHAVRNLLPLFAGRVVPGTRNDLPQLPELVERGKAMLEIFLGRLEPHMAGQDFIAGPAVSIADITGFFTVRMATPLEIDIAGRYPSIARWHAAFAARPSVAQL